MCRPRQQPRNRLHAPPATSRQRRLCARTRTRAVALLLAAAVFLPPLLNGCTRASNALAEIKRRGELVVLTRNSPTTFYEGPTGLAGIEYDMAKAFADELGVTLKMKVIADSAEIIPLINAGKADFAAAGVVVTDERRKLVRFAPEYQEIVPQVVYRLGTKRPLAVKDLVGRQIEIAAHSSHAERLRQLQATQPDLEWRETTNTEVEELLLSVWEGLLEFTVADSNILALNRQYYPELQAALALAPPQKLAWAFPPGADTSLYDAAVDFMKRLQKRELKVLIERYYGPTNRFNYINTAHYLARIRDKLPTYRVLFERAGVRYNLDWRLLAAIGYQESYWDPAAVSPTGVQGIMQLTMDTSNYLGVTDRRSPEQSIDGGARYLRAMIDRMPPRVLQPDRTWMALAAYNVGLSHLEDARIITQQQGGDPNKWHDLEKYLPLLAKEEWYSKTKYGYARGYEPVQYVHRIRSYYDILVKIDESERAKDDPIILQLKAPAI